jgi:peptide/nickel transport system permease protein
MKKIGKVFTRFWAILREIGYRYRYMWQRLGLALMTLFFTTIISFFLVRNIPGDVILSYAQELAIQRGITIEEAMRLAVQILNYDPEANIFVQFFEYLGGLLRGNLGSSMYVLDVAVVRVIRQTLPWTLFVASIALILSFLIGTWLGTRLAWRRKGAEEIAVSSYIVVSNSIPDYLFGLLLLYVFAYTYPIFPTNGNYDIMTDPGINLPFIGSVLYHAALPILALVFTQVGNWALMMKGSAVGVLGEDYINAAKARGIPDRIIVKKYLKKNAMLPLITSLAISFAYLFGGSTLMETIFNYPGIGQQFASYIGRLDYPMIQGILFFISSVVIFVNLIADSIYSLVDPRVRRDA